MPSHGRSPQRQQRGVQDLLIQQQQGKQFQDLQPHPPKQEQQGNRWQPQQQQQGELLQPQQQGDQFQPQPQGRSASAPRGQRGNQRNPTPPKGRGVPSQKTSLERRSVPQPTAGSSAGGSSTSAAIDRLLGYPVEEFAVQTSRKKEPDMWTRVTKYESEGCDDQTGPYHFHWPWRDLGSEALPTLEILHSRLIQAWNRDYPSGNYPVESTAEADIQATTVAGCSKRMAAWLQLGKAEHVKTVRSMYGGAVPKQLTYLLRLDMFGNVVAREAICGSLCFFNLDHLFPRSRGGCTVLSNLVALSQITNSDKGNVILNGIIRVQKSKKNPLIVRDLVVMEPVGKLPLRTVQLKQGIRAQHIQQIWLTACSAAGHDPDQMPPNAFLSEVLAVLRPLLFSPWSWKPEAGNKKAFGNAASSPSKAIELHRVPYANGHVSALHDMLLGMSQSILWLPEVLAWLFPPGRGYMESPLLAAALVAEEAADQQELQEQDWDEAAAGGEEGTPASASGVGPETPQAMPSAADDHPFAVGVHDQPADAINIAAAPAAAPAVSPSGPVISGMMGSPAIQLASTLHQLPYPPAQSGLLLARAVQPPQRLQASGSPITPTVSRAVHLSSSAIAGNNSLRSALPMGALAGGAAASGAVHQGWAAGPAATNGTNSRFRPATGPATTSSAISHHGLAASTEVPVFKPSFLSRLLCCRHD